MAFINVGAYVNNARPASKAALKRAMKEAPETVRFDRTAAVGPDAGKPDIKGTEVPEGDTMVVVGPNPYTERKWYGNVKHGRNGVVVS
jgi:hypothetical protein